MIRVAVLDDHMAVRAGLEAILGAAPDMVLVGSAHDAAGLDRLLRHTDPSVLGPRRRPPRAARPGAIEALGWVTTFSLIGYGFSETFQSAGRNATASPSWEHWSLERLCSPSPGGGDWPVADASVVRPHDTRWVNRWLNGSIRPRFRTIDGLSVRFAESEERDDHALLLSPWPESLYAFEPTWLRLAEHTHLVAVDLPGFGHSQRRDALFSPRAMGAFVIRLADAFGLDNPHVIGPDIGTGASLFAAALAPDRLRSLVVGSGGAAFPLQLGGVLKAWVDAPDLEAFRSADPRQIVGAALDAGLDRYALPDHVREDYLSAYDGDRFVESMRYVRCYPTELAILRDLLPQILTPVQIIAGARDPSVPPVNAEYLHERLPNSKLDLIDAGHFTWEDGADEYAALVTSWWGACRSTTEGAHP